MQRHFMLAATLGLAGCAGGYTSATLTYGEPAENVYVVPVDRVVVVSREVLVRRGWTVYRVERSGRNRVIWGRRGDGEIVRIFATPDRDRVVVRGLWEVREERRDRHDRGRHRGWTKKGQPRDIIADIDVRLRAR